MYKCVEMVLVSSLTLTWVGGVVSCVANGIAIYVQRISANSPVSVDESAEADESGADDSYPISERARRQSIVTKGDMQEAGRRKIGNRMEEFKGTHRDKPFSEASGKSDLGPATWTVLANSYLPLVVVGTILVAQCEFAVFGLMCLGWSIWRYYREEIVLGVEEGVSVYRVFRSWFVIWIPIGMDMLVG